MRSLVIGTAGHIDHGKSALVEALTGTNPDRLKEEQARGITIDLGFAHLVEGDAAIAFVDVPGHERFVRNMLAGAGGVDAVMLVVAADESLMPQTREHFDICRLLGIGHGLVAITKSDLVDAETLALVAAEVREAVAGSFLDGAPTISVSARTGDGLGDLRAALAALAGVAPRQARDGLTRLPVDRVFTVKGFGTVVTGTLVSGRLAEGDEVHALPDARPVRVRGVQVHGRPSAEVVAPRRVAINIGAVDIGDLSRGVTLATPGSLPVIRRADARFVLLKSARPLVHGARVRVHHGTSEMLARVRIAAIREGDARGFVGAEAGRAGVEIPAGGEAYVRLRFERPAVLTRGDRVVVRAYSPPVTIGGGTVLDPEPPPGRLRRAAALERFRRIDGADTVFRVWLVEAGGRGIDLTSFVRRGGLSRAAAEAACASGVAAGWALAVGDRVFDSGVAGAVEADMLAELAAFHAAEPAEAGVPRADLRHRVAPESGLELFEAVTRRLVDTGRIAGADRLRLAQHRPGLDEARARVAERIVGLIKAADLAPPDVASLAASATLSRGDLTELVRLLVRDRVLVRVDSLVFHPDALARLRNEIRGLGSGATIDVAMMKGRYQLSRKYAIPLLEWLDRERVTRRVGNSRVVLGG